PASSRRLRERSLPGSCPRARRAPKAAVVSAVVVGLLAALATNLPLNPRLHVLRHDANDWFLGHSQVVTWQLHDLQLPYDSAPTTIGVNTLIAWLELNRAVVHALGAE